MNIHHLELFYYVATHGGISKAVRKIPYGIQQPAVSGQILQLEEELGTKLFERQPFKLSPPGEELYASIQPFFSGLSDLAARVSKKNTPRLAIGAAEFVLSDHLPAILEKVRKTQPEFRLSLRSGYQAQFEEWLLAHEIDLAITPVERKPPARIKRFPLVSLTLSLLVPKASKLRDAKELFAKDVLREPLISLPPTETVSLLFQTELKRRKIDWLPSIEASSLAVLNRYVENGYGIGLSLMMPGTGVPKELRALPLPEFPRLAVQALWHEDCSPLLQSVLEELKRHAARLASLAGEGR